MSDPAGILVHLQLIAAVHDVIEAVTEPRSILGTLAEQEREVRRRTAVLGVAYNRSLRWSKTVSKAMGTKP